MPINTATKTFTTLEEKWKWDFSAHTNATAIAINTHVATSMKIVVSDSDTNWRMGTREPSEWNVKENVDEIEKEY